MLFDLRGRGRRRAIQVIYASLALLMGGGLVFFGIGGNTSGGLFDAFNGGNGSQSADAAFSKRVDTLEQRVKANPLEAAAWASLAGLRFQTAGVGDNFDQSNQVYTDKGRAELRRASAAWQRHVALDPQRPDATVANQMVQAYGPAGLQDYDKATQAMEVVVDARKPTSSLYAQLAIYAHAAKQERKSKLSEDKAVALAPAKQRKQVRQAIQSGYTQIDQQTAQAQKNSGA